MKKDQLSPVMLAALQHFRTHGELIRKQGGFWVGETEQPTGGPTGPWRWYVKSQTIRSLESRGLIRATRRSQWGPWGYELTAKAKIGNAPVKGRSVSCEHVTRGE